MPDSLTVQLANQTSSHNVHAFITGLAIQHNMARVFLKPDGRDLYYPESPPPGTILQPLTQDCAIPLGPPGNTVTVIIPQIAGGRIWFSAEKQLTFLRNPGGPGGGAALVEPSVLNPSDPNANVDFSFCEFTLNSDQLFANISYVDFVPRLPIALTLHTKDGAVQHVSGMAPDGLERVCAGLREQTARDGWPWDKLVVQPNGHDRPLRVLSPTHGNAVGASFDGYFEPLVEAAWKKYCTSEEQPPPPPQQLQPQSQQQTQQEPEPSKKHRLRLSLLRRKPKPDPNPNPASPPATPPQPQPQPTTTPTTLRINTQAAPGILTSHIPPSPSPLLLHIGPEAFPRPSTADILGCNSGPFTTGPSPTRNAIIPRLAAAFQRGCIVATAEHPSGPEPGEIMVTLPILVARVRSCRGEQPSRGFVFRSRGSFKRGRGLWSSECPSSSNTGEELG
ncbi:glycoside hydrolase family 64 protein [Chaetomium tenue]|uniref:Glycoside hydrolase family 64 protein n=1 Tax=Chaetomium tenue TaxID=1854479 RepID=A0ACB7PJD9_9PEZI|nr:glycoside hydrolase family 64 protein [Chaetomium globosum]